VTVGATVWVGVPDFFGVALAVLVEAAAAFVEVAGRDVLVEDGLTGLVAVIVADEVKAAVFVKLGVKVNVGVSVCVAVEVAGGVSVGRRVLVAVAESATISAVCTTIVEIKFSSKVGIAVGDPPAGAAHASAITANSEQNDKIRFMAEVILPEL
jgi:hypothetical protein